jgi:MtaA/CmuA family methyltransferase
MNGYERVMAMVSGEKADCVPRIPILMHFAARHIGASYADFAGNHRVLVEANMSLVREFGFDQLDVMSDPWRETSAFGGVIEYRESTIPLCSHPLAASRDLALLERPDPLKSERMRAAVEAVREYRRRAWRQYSITGWVEGPAAEAADLRGFSAFMIDLIDDEAFACELMDLCTQTAVEYALAQIEAGADTIGIGDAAASQISPDMYVRLVLPREKRIVHAVHEAGALARLHICGDINHLVPAMGELGVDILDCDWMVDMERARRILGRKVTLAGNLDPVAAVMNSTPARIREGFETLYAKVGNPYLVTAGCEIPEGTPDENLRALCSPIPVR